MASGEQEPIFAVGGALAIFLKPNRLTSPLKDTRAHGNITGLILAVGKDSPRGFRALGKKRGDLRWDVGDPPSAALTI